LIPSGTSDPKPVASRLVYVDNLRIFLTMLVMVHHTAIAFGAPGGWYYVIPATGDRIAPLVLTALAAINQAYFMSLFFLVSAYFTVSSFDRKGGAVFIKDRLLRLGIPLLFYSFVLNPTLIYFIYRFQGGIEAGYLRFMTENIFRMVNPGPLWFVQTLLIFAFVYATIRFFGSHREGSEGRRPLPSNKSILVFIGAVGFFTFLVRFWCPAGVNNLLFLQLGYFPLYICMYIFGVRARRQGWFEQLSKGQANGWFGAAVLGISTLPLVIALGSGPDGVQVFMGGPTWQALFYALWEPLLCVGISMKLILWFRDRGNRQNRVLRNMAKSAYTAYILHPFFVVFGSFCIGFMQLPPLLAFVVLSIVVVTTCFAVSDGVRRLPFLRRIL
jgi:glucans biosynthesis protein C